MCSTFRVWAATPALLLALTLTAGERDFFRGDTFVEGTVTDARTGQPLADVQTALRISRGFGVYTTYDLVGTDTDAAGRFPLSSGPSFSSRQPLLTVNAGSYGDTTFYAGGTGYGEYIRGVERYRENQMQVELEPVAP